MNVERWAWSEFWGEQHADGRACLHRAPPSVHDALSQHWRATAKALPANARLIDLGCGSGIVARQLSQARPDLHVDGVDYAASPPRQRLDRVTFWPATSIENLPFADQTFDGAVSQFGFEYCHVADGVREVARVLAPGAIVSFIVHHARGPIARDNLLSDGALRHLLSPSMEQAFLGGHADAVMRLIASLAPSHRADATVDLLANTLTERVTFAPHRRMRCWTAVMEALKPELALSAALKRSAVAASAMKAWLTPFCGYFCDIRPSELHVDQQPFAWQIEARRSANPI